MLVILSVLWGGSFFFNEVALRAFEPLTLVFLRVSLAALVLLIYLRATGEKMPGTGAAWTGFFIMGGLNNLIPFSLIVWGQTHIDSGLASILNATTPLFTVILAHFLTSDEKLTPARMLGVGLGLAGVAILIGPEALLGMGAAVLGQIAILGAALSYGFAGIFGRRFRGTSAAVASAGMLCGSAVMVLPLALIFERPFEASPGFDAWSAIVGLAIFSTAIAYLLFFRILAAAGATSVMLVTFLVPVSAMGLGVFVLGEAFTLNAALGMALIFAGLAAVDGRLAARVRRRKTA
ncbi:MAG: DMT family transporter [Alphaproteobacteria bacterium]